MPNVITQFPPSISVANLNGVNGFAITGFPAGSYGGGSVSGAGDVNGDGIADLIVGAPYASSEAGASYVIFGKLGLGNSGSISVSSLVGSNGFAITGISAPPNPPTLIGWSVSGAGDVNGDSISDVIIGGESFCYVLFGKLGVGSSGSVSVSSFTGSSGFDVIGFPTNSQLSLSVSRAGDVNGDGIGDLIIGSNNMYLDGGVGYVIFGKLGLGTSGSINVANLNGNNGFAIIGFPVGYGIRSASVAGAGDVNGDGIEDLIIGAPYAFTSTGAGYVLFGKSGIGSSGSVSVANLNGSNGFAITGFPQYSEGGFSVSGAGDVNNDGIADLIIGILDPPSGDTGGSYVLFGKSAIGSSGSVSVAGLTGLNGFAITGFPVGSYGGSSLSAAGDVNGDGISDLIIGAYGVSNNAGASYVIFGQSGIGSSGSLSIASLNGSNGFAITGFLAGSDGGISVSGAGDVNGDGVADLIIGASYASSNAGASYVIFGESLILLRNQLTLKEAQTLMLSSQNLNATNPQNPLKDSALQFMLSGIQHGRFYSSTNTGLSLTSFTQQQVQSGEIYFTHDGSGWAPSYNVSLGYPGLFGVTTFDAADITFQQSFVLVNNTLTFDQGQTIVLTSSYLSAKDLYNSANNPNLVFSINRIQYGYFALINASSTPITTFTQTQIQNGKMQFVWDSTNPPSYNVVVINGAASIPAQAAMISFYPPVILNNRLTVGQGQSVILSSDNLSATNSYNDEVSLGFSVVNVRHGYFALITSAVTPITSFTQTQIQNGVVLFVQDGSANAPSFNVAINNWPLSLRPCMITFNALPVLDRNVMTLQQGQTITLTPENLHSIYLASPNPQLTFIINKIQYGYFAFNGSSQALIDFTQAQVDSGAVQFISDGGIIPPSYTIAVSDGLSISSPQIGVINFTPSLLLVNNTLLISKPGQTIILSDAQLDAVNPGNSTSSLSFTVSNIQHGFFSLVSRPSTAITHFTHQQVQQGKVQFSQDGSSNAPSYQVTVTDGRQIIPSQSSHVIFNLAPQFQTNRLSISSGGFVILSSSELSATDPDDPAEQLVFTVSQVQQGAFILSHDTHLALEKFTQAQVQAGEIAFLADGGPEAPSYLVGVSDGYSTTSSIPEITFTSPSAVSAAIDEVTVRNAIYGGTAGGVVGLLFFAVQLYLNRRMTKNLLALEKQHETEIEKRQADYYQHAVKPVVERLFSEVDTTIICGYRGEKDTLHYQAAVESIISHLAKLGNSVDTHQVSPVQYSQLRNSIIDQIKIQAKKNYKCCSKAYCCHFFKPEISAKELEDRAAVIATAISAALSNPTSGTSLQSPISGGTQRSTSDVELATVNFQM